MSTQKIISKSDYRRATWKNGLGHTDEIAIFPPGAELKRGDFLWRLSSARIEQASPFSIFPEHDRILLVLKGGGIRLIHSFDGDEETVDLPVMSAYEFPGDISSRCELTEGPITDLSVFIRKAEADAVADGVALEQGSDHFWTPAGRWNFLHSVQSDLEVISPLDGSQVFLREGDTLCLELDEPLSEDQQFRIRSIGERARLVTVSLNG